MQLFLPYMLVLVLHGHLSITEGFDQYRCFAVREYYRSQGVDAQCVRDYINQV